MDSIERKARNCPVYLRVQLVNRQWNSVASKELERRNLLHWTSWEPLPDSWDGIESRFSPVVLVLETPGKLTHSRLSLPPAISTSKTFKINPFPTNSLTVQKSIRSSSWTQLFFSHILQRSTRWDNFFFQYGHFLTSFNLYGIEVTPWHLKKQVLIHTPNLQALSIVGSGDIPAATQQNRHLDRIIISPKLATIRICWDDCQLCLANWLLGLCAHQLVNLFIATENEELLHCALRRKFDKLKQLQIHSFQFCRAVCEIWQDESHPELEYLFVGMVIIDDKGYMDFIGQFSSTLVHLCLEMAPISRGYFGYLKEKGIVFLEGSLTHIAKTRDQYC
ncbi:unnamed protein product [Orchesella dallaii]|uniref:Uncharacterized protein n=1 Tax=Orchesella dallaii TaxID=48710 RepID=A0ABP1RVN4_9HEXA